MNEDKNLGVGGLAPTATVQSDAPSVKAFAREHEGSGDPRSRALALYYAVRDGIRYDPYTAELTVQEMAAPRTLEVGRGWCVPKAILLAAVCRASGIPARLGFADVRNHLSTANLRESMGTDIFYWHGYTAIGLDGEWLKATPAFNIGLCEKFGFLPLDFNGREDSIYHPFDCSGSRHMEYVAYRGEFDDVPLDDMIETFRREYPRAILEGRKADFDAFDVEVEQETGNGRSDESR
ncbi:MAG: transglutaminase-like putative cysteine protease [Hyphomicrobiaceae bacterium]|jgi:transglutaminase-like putative cysteine protease